jgi:hypothetical protein
VTFNFAPTNTLSKGGIPFVENAREDFASYESAVDCHATLGLVRSLVVWMPQTKATVPPSDMSDVQF